MSVFGGDSWGREAQHRKRRWDDLLLEELVDGSSYKKLSNGKYACLVCSHSPTLPSSILLSFSLIFYPGPPQDLFFSPKVAFVNCWKSILRMHTKVSRHRAAESKLKETELRRQDKINKQVALSDSSTGTANCNAYHQKFRSVGKPLIEQTRNVASEILNNKTPPQNSSNANHDLQLILDRLTDGNSNLNQNSPCRTEVTDMVVVQPHLDFRERRERELKFTAAGWKCDCQGKWFRDENVEFNSDEDDPNVCLG